MGSNPTGGSKDYPMKEKQLIKLGFKQEFSIDTTDDEHDFYYYTLDISRGLSFISSANDESLDDNWSVEILESGIHISDYHDLKKLIKLITKLVGKYGVADGYTKD